MLLAVGSSFACNATAAPYPDSELNWVGRIYTNAGYFRSTANYGVEGGSYSTLGSGRYYQLINGLVGGEYQLIEDFTIFAELGMARAESSDGTYTRTNSSLTDATGGLRYVLGRTAFNVVAEFWMSYPFSRVEFDTDEVLTHEGTMKIDAGIWADWPLGSFVPYSRVGFLYQDDERASYAELLLGAAWQPGRFRLAAEAYGNYVVVDDNKVDRRIERDQVTSRVDGGSWKYYSVNPQTLGARANVDVNLGDSFLVGLTYDQTLNGEASAAGWTALVRLEMRFGSNEEETTFRPKVLERPDVEEIKFVPETPDYDSSLFKDPKPKKEKPAKRKKPGKKPVDVDKALEDVQRSLEH